MGLTKTADFTQAHDFPDPAKASGTKEQILAQFRAVRDQIREHSGKFTLDNL